MKGVAGWQETATRLEPYSYALGDELPAACADWDLPCVDSDGRILAPENAAPPGGMQTAEDLELRLAEEARRSFAAGRERGMEEGRTAERAAHAPAEQHRSEELRRLLGELAAERDHYLRAVEREVVRLALAIAARILRREAQMDPLLLMGAVRVALGQLAPATEVQLHVPDADAELWKEAVALLPNPPIRPVVIGEADMRLGECRLATGLGQVDLSVGAQLDEIERGFLDRATAPARMPAVAEPCS